MNKLFERYVSELIRLHSPEDVTVETQYTLYLDIERRVQLIPDIVVKRDGRVVAVADCKYKLSAPDEFKNHDVYQVLTYLVATGAPVGMLIYPSVGARSTDALSVVDLPVDILQAPFPLNAPSEQVSVHAESLVGELLGETPMRNATEPVYV